MAFAHTATIAVGTGASKIVRQLVTERLTATGHANFIPDAQLLASELVSNVMRHTNCSHCHVVFVVADGDLRISVTDDEPDTVPTVLALDPQRTSGNGLRILASLATAWGFTTSAETKTVWFELKSS